MNRYIRNRAGESIEEISTADGVTEETVKASIRIIDVSRQHMTSEFMRESLIDVVMQSGKKTKEAILGALSATITTEVTDSKGKKRKVSQPDHDTRLKAVDRITHIATAVQPKGGGTNVNVGVGVGVKVPQSGVVFAGMEDRLREIRQKMKDAPQLQAREVVGNLLEAPSGEFADADEEGDDE